MKLSELKKKLENCSNENERKALEKEIALKEYQREYQKNYKKAHNDELKSYQKSYRETHKEEAKAYRENNRDKNIEYQRNKRLAHKAEIAESIKRFSNVK